MQWQPSASIEFLKQRAEVLHTIRQFFAERQVLEVETPLLARAGVTDINIHSITAEFEPLGSKQRETCYLQTSPEYAMKRLLAAGSGCIFQICKAFRNGEVGRWHNPEFTMLEWYRIGFSYRELMSEVDALLQCLLKTEAAEQHSYQEAFIKYLTIDPLSCSIEDLQQLATQKGITIQANLNRDDWLNLLFSTVIEPQLGKYKPVFIYHYPASQAALAQLSQTDPRVAERFEAFYHGYELANGWTELIDSDEQRKRFEADLAERAKRNMRPMPIDENLLAALKHIPQCAGIAMGLDRLLMVLFNKKFIKEVQSFDFTRM